MNLFYSPGIRGGMHQLPEEESVHMVRVLRMKPGNLLLLTDGAGKMFEAVVTVADPKRCTVQIIKTLPEEPERSFLLHIAIAPTKNTDRFEWFLEKATEIGIDRITPLLCDHSERIRLNSDRLTKVLIAAMKQSLKSYLPELKEPAGFREFVAGPFDGQKFIAWCSPEETVSLQTAYRKGVNALILIGPEGDFSPEEVAIAKKQGFIPISLGKSRLRTETAGIVACHTVGLMNEG